MLTALNIQSFCLYAIACIVLSLNLLLVWLYSGAVRGKSNQAINPEDSARFGIPLADSDPAPVARVLRAHANAQAAILPFLLLGLVFVLAGGTPIAAAITFGIFTLVRLVHTYVYLAGKQPWRTITYLVGLLTTLVLIVEIILRLVTLMSVA